MLTHLLLLACGAIYGTSNIALKSPNFTLYRPYFVIILYGLSTKNVCFVDITTIDCFRDVAYAKFQDFKDENRKQ